jgi:hypothetical protein
MSAWRRSISSTKKVKQASGWRVAVVVVVACSRERHRLGSEAISIRPNRIARPDGGTNMFRSIKLPPMWRSHRSVTAVHSHMLAEQPRLFFMHFWADDEAIKLAKGLRAALDQVALAKD